MASSQQAALPVVEQNLVFVAVLASPDVRSLDAYQMFFLEFRQK